MMDEEEQDSITDDTMKVHFGMRLLGRATYHCHSHLDFNKARKPHVSSVVLVK